MKSGVLAYAHIVIFTHEGVEKVRVVYIPLSKVIDEKAVSDILLRDFGIKVDSIIQVNRI